MDKLNIVVFVSGRGSNLQAVLDNCQSDLYPARVVAVLSNRSKAGGLDIARSRTIPAIHISPKHFDSETEYETELTRHLETFQADLLVLAGYLKKSPSRIIRQYRNRIINIHPALLPAFGGEGLYGRRVHEAVLSYGCKVSGATVHIVDEDYDTGPPVIQECVPVLDDDTPESLAARILLVEHKILPTAIRYFAENRIQVQAGRVRILKID